LQLHFYILYWCTITKYKNVIAKLIHIEIIQNRLRHHLYISELQKSCTFLFISKKGKNTERQRNVTKYIVKNITYIDIIK